MGFGVTFAVGFFEIFSWIVNWIIKITNKWWWNLIVVGILLIGLVILIATSKTLKKWAERRSEKSRRQRLKQGAEEVKHLQKDRRALTKQITK